MPRKLCSPDPDDPEHEKCTYTDHDFLKIVYTYYMIGVRRDR